eukprot:SAG11_NODE_101_length_16738_cov_8.254703_2_plen_81_part_00
MVDVGMLLDRVRELRAENCTVDLAAVSDGDGDGSGQHRRTQLMANFGSSDACADISTLSQRASDVDSACCPEGADVCVSD